MVQVRSYIDSDFLHIKALWEEVFPEDPPWNRAEAAIPAKLAHQPELLLVAIAGGKPVGTVLAGYDGHRGWLYALAVSPAHQRKGIGAVLVREAEDRLHALGCGKLNLQVRASTVSPSSRQRRINVRLSQRAWLASQLICGQRRRPSQRIRAEWAPLLCIGPIIIARRYT
jgi:ribosomal protein S18 acetylase RimI-like enzyme